MFEDEPRESIRVVYLARTTKAWYVANPLTQDACWVPQSQCDILPVDASKGDEVWLQIPKWLLRKKPELEQVS